jgi:tryptophan 2,3-dioxygenase
MTNPPREELIEPAAQAVTYASYLKVKELLALQQPLTEPEQHDETLFIVIHQVYELWFKQILHELDAAEEALKNDQPMLFIRIAKRIGTIQSVLTHQVDILETMTPVDFNRFREKLNPASGFQSMQFRVLEFRLGSKEQAYMKFHKNDAFATRSLEAATHAPTVYDHFLAMLKRRGFDVPDAVLRRDVTQAYQSNDGVREVILKIYRESERHYDLYSTLEALIDLDEGILLWRYRHVAMVERMIGSRKGTGGSSGVRYLSHTLAKRFFPEIWEARNGLGDAYGSKGGEPLPGPR